MLQAATVWVESKRKIVNLKRKPQINLMICVLQSYKPFFSIFIFKVLN